MKSGKDLLEYIDVVRWEGDIIHVLGRREESAAPDASTFKAYHIRHDAQSGEIIDEDFFIHAGSFPLFMCGCYVLTCQGDCPPLLDNELALKIQGDSRKAARYDSCVQKFREKNLSDMNVISRLNLDMYSGKPGM